MPAWLDKLLAPRRGDRPAEQPAAPDAAALLSEGNRHLNEGRLAAAQSSYERALALDPMSAGAAVNLGFVQLEQGLRSEAATSLRRSIEIDPSNADGLFMLGRLELESGNATTAQALLERAEKAQAGFALAGLWLARARAQAGDLAGAADAAQAALAADPPPEEAADLQFVLGQVHRQQDDLPQALVHFEAALTRDAHHARARIHLASVLGQLSRVGEARQHLAQTLSSMPGDAPTCYQLGVELQAVGMADRAEAAYRAALRLDPTHAPALQNLGAWLQSHGDFAGAIECYTGVTNRHPESSDAWCNLGCAHRDLAQRDRAEQCFRRALVADPKAAAPHSHLGTLAFDRGDPEQALALFERALELDPSALDTRSMQLYVMSFSASPERYLSQARVFGQLATERATPYRDWLVDTASGTQPGELRVGIVSGDLQNHPVGYFLESVLEGLRTHGISVTAFTTREDADDMTRRIRARCAQWVSLVGIPDDQAAERIREQRIHVLLDLAGHSGHSRLPVFAWRPAPVQATWLGFFASTGLPAMDYLVGDLPTVPDDILDQFSETVLRLPQTRLCFAPPAVAQTLPVAPLPALAGGHLTLGCNQHLNKINARVVRVWRNVLEALPKARLRVQNKQTTDGMRAAVMARLTGGGIDPARVTLVAPAARERYLASYRDIDFLLDTFPFPGGTTTAEALWMGVPTLTMRGDTMLANQGAGMLTCVGLDAWIANDEDDYCRRAVALAADVGSLARLREGLRATVVQSPLMDERRFAEVFAGALFEMWRRGPRASVP
jgi:protein O-GlcNAc transferase